MNNFADPLGLDLFPHYPNIVKKISLVQVEQALKVEPPLQSQNSNLCGFYCIYTAYFLFSSYYPNIPYIIETDLHRFEKQLKQLIFQFLKIFIQRKC